MKLEYMHSFLTTMTTHADCEKPMLPFPVDI